MCWECVTSSSRRSLKPVSDSPDTARSPPSKVSPPPCSGDLPIVMRKLFRTFQRAWGRRVLSSWVVDHLPLLPFEKLARILFPVHLIHDHLPQIAGDHLPQMSVGHSENV